MPKGFPKVDKPQLAGHKKLSAKWPHTRGDEFVGGREFSPTQEQRVRVKTLAAMGASKLDIATVLRIHVKTLRKYFPHELEEGSIEANAQVAGKLFANAMGGNVIAQIFWMKARGGWIDRREVNHNVQIGPMMSHEERLAALEHDPGGDEGSDDEEGPPTVDGDAEEIGDDEGEAAA